MPLNIRKKISNAKLLWVIFSATVLCTVLFQFLVDHYSLILLDTISEPHLVAQAISEMSKEQTIIHAWITATLDVIYPLLYVTFFIGSAYAFFPKIAPYVSGVIFLCVPIDLIEGVIQIFALLNIVDWVYLKLYVTPIKQMLIVLGLLITVSGWIKWLWLYFFNYFNRNDTEA